MSFLDIYTDAYLDTYGVPSGDNFGVILQSGSAGGTIRDSRPQTGFGTIALIPGRGATLEAPRGRGYAGLAPGRAEDQEHDWSEPAPAVPPGPTIGELTQAEAARAGRALYALGAILAPEPYRHQPKTGPCHAQRTVGGRVLRCGRSVHTDGRHESDDGIAWR